MLKEMFENVNKDSIKFLRDNMDKFVDYLTKITQKDSES